MNRFFCILLLAILASCASDDKKQITNPDAVFNDAQAAYKKKDFAKAAELFKDLEKQFPYSKHTKDGMLKSAYAQFELKEYEEAAQIGKRYLELYPGAKNSDYALHLVAMCHYNRIDDPRRDQAVTLEAKRYLQNLISRYPDSDYAVDAQIKLDFVNDQLAAKEMQVGRFYLDQDQLPAAINRFKAVVSDYDTTNHVKEALYRITEAYLSLGLKTEAHKAALLLGKNYPESSWYKKAYKLLGDN